MKLPAMPSMSVTGRLLALATVALLPALAVLLYFLTALHRERVARIHEDAFRVGELASLEIERIFSGAEAVLVTLTRAPVIRDFASRPCDTLLGDVVERLPQFDVIAAFDASQLMRCVSEPASGTLRAEQEHIREAARTGQLAIGTYGISRVSGDTRLPIAVPIMGDDGEVIGTLAGGIDLDWLQARIRERNLPAGGALTIADREGTIIAREPFAERFIGTRIPDEYRRLVTASEPGTLEVVSQDGTRRVIGYFPVDSPPRGLYISAGLSTEAALAPINQATRRAMVIALFGAAGAYAAAWLAGRRLLRQPIERMLATVAAWRAGDETKRTGMRSDRDELASLGAALDRFMDELVVGRAARRQAEDHRDLLVRELDHRVKNTLATVQALARQTFGGKVEPELLSLLSGRLAALAQGHEMLTAEGWQGADLRKAVEKAVAPFEDPATPRFALTGPALKIPPRAALALTLAMHELATNAAKYGALLAPGGRIRIAWSLQDEHGPERLRLVWQESGGPAVEPPRTSGFGTLMLQRVLAAELGGTVSFDFAPSGLVVTIDAVPDQALAEPPAAAAE